MSEVRKTSQMAKAWTESDQDETGALLDATARIIQDHLLRISIALRKNEDTDPEESAKHVATIGRALADLGRVSLSQKKWAKEQRMDLARQAADVAEKVARRGGLAAETVDQIRKEILGIA